MDVARARQISQTAWNMAGFAAKKLEADPELASIRVFLYLVAKDMREYADEHDLTARTDGTRLIERPAGLTA